MVGLPGESPKEALSEGAAQLLQTQSFWRCQYHGMITETVEWSQPEL